jgi:hypothetical protein
MMNSFFIWIWPTKEFEIWNFSNSCHYSESEIIIYFNILILMDEF